MYGLWQFSLDFPGEFFSLLGNFLYYELKYCFDYASTVCCDFYSTVHHVHLSILPLECQGSLTWLSGEMLLTLNIYT